MEDRGLRDIERWRDKIEVRLDNRQVFFLFFGSALVACMLFVLGVIVGKRLESRGRAVSPEIEDPLALLDKVATTPRTTQTGVTFPQALFGNGGRSGATDKHGKKALLQSPSPTAPAMASDKPEAVKDAIKTVALVEPAKTAPATTKPALVPPVMTEQKPAPAEPEPKAEAKVSETASAPKPVDNAAKPKVAEAKEDRPAAIPTIAAGETKGKARYALQLSSFQDKSEAEAFAQKFEGERPYLVVSDIPGKGTWYRVRVGDYASSKDAVVAKQSFEKKHNVIAYVSQK
jgi:septal ring-binding cell division protein DamX